MAEPSKQRESRSVTPGQYYPLGATIQETGVNFALYSQNASEVFLLLFDKEDGGTSRDHQGRVRNEIRVARPSGGAQGRSVVWLQK